MNCSTVSVNIDSYSETISETLQKAQQTHKCHECSRIINPGEIYERYVGKQDELFVNKTCSDCLSIRKEFFKDGYEFGGLTEYMAEHIRDCRSDISEASLSRLTPAARAWVCDEIQEGWEDDE